MTHATDIPEPQDAEIFRFALEVLSTGIALLDRQRKIVFWNEGAEKITGYRRLDAVGHTSEANILSQCNGVSCVHCGATCPLSQAIHEGKPSEIQGYLHHKAGHSVPVRLRVNPIRDQHGSVVAIAESFDEERAGTEPEFRENSLAAHGCLDVITGVPNHAFTQSHLRENLAFFDEYHLPFGILCIEVSGADQVRTTHGREALDVVLHVIAQTMKHALRPDGFLGRWADTQFLGIVTNCGNADLERAAENVHKMANCSGIHWWDDLLSVSVSVGRSMAQPGDTMESLVERAFHSHEKGQEKAASTPVSSGGSQAGAGS